MKTLFLAIAVLLGAGSVGLATPYANYDNLEYWAGDAYSANKATLVVDFGSDHYFAFGYRWDGSATGWDMLSGICAAGGLDEIHSGQADVGYGVMIKSISYDGYYMDNDDTYGPDDTWLIYWESADGDGWSTCWYGCSSNPISNGGWNGWTATPAGTWPGAAPVPEPVGISAMVFGGLMLLRRRRRWIHGCGRF